MIYQTSDDSQLLRRVLWINAQLTIVWSLKHHSTQPILIFNRENPQNSESPNGPRRGLDFIALIHIHSLPILHQMLISTFKVCGMALFIATHVHLSRKSTRGVWCPTSNICTFEFLRKEMKKWICALDNFKSLGSRFLKQFNFKSFIIRYSITPLGIR